jgi:hypothetical protein
MHIQDIAGAIYGTFLRTHWLTKIKGGFLFVDFPFGGFSLCSSNIMKAPGAALCVYEKLRELLYAHTKYGGSCSIYIMKAGGKFVNRNWLSSRISNMH